MAAKSCCHVPHSTKTHENCFISTANNLYIAVYLLSIYADVYSLCPFIPPVFLRPSLADPPLVRCLPASAGLDERNVFLQCVVRARPSLTSLYWQIDTNGTTVAEGTVKDEYWTLVMVRHRSLYIIYNGDCIFDVSNFNNNRRL